MSIASDFFAPALRAEPRPKIAAPNPIARLREILSLTLPASIPVNAEGTRMICTQAVGRQSSDPEESEAEGVIHRDDQTADERRKLSKLVLERLHLGDRPNATEGRYC